MRRKYPVPHKLTLGQIIEVRRGYNKDTRKFNTEEFKFIKVTRKGFNLVSLTTHKCISPRTHFYAKKFSHKNIPPTITTVVVGVPLWVSIQIRPVKQAKKKTT